MQAIASKPTRPLGHIPSLDGIRALSFLLVFAGHGIPPQYMAIIPPAFGVTVFFVLSGYLITTLLRIEFEKSGTISLKNFYLRRALRILPPFYIAIAALVLLAKARLLDGTVEFLPIAALAGHVGNYWMIYRGLEGMPRGAGVFWSLAVEEHFYLVFPLFFLFLRRLSSARAQVVALAAVCAIVLAWRIVLVTVFDADVDRISRASDARLDSILIGCGLGIWANPMLDAPVLTEKTFRFVAVPAALLGLLATFLIRNHIFHDAIRGTIQAVSLCPLLVLAIRSPELGPLKLLNGKAISFIGVLSYTLYLIHRALLYVVEKGCGTPWWATMILALPASIAVAYAIHIYVEKPCARMRKRLSPT